MQQRSPPPPSFPLSFFFSLFFLLLFKMQKQPLDYSKEPTRPAHQLIVRKDKPFNAEPQLQDLVKHYITPDQYHFIRSHGPVPMHLDAATHFITIITHDNHSHRISVNDLINKFEKHHVMMAMQVLSPCQMYIHVTAAGLMDGVLLVCGMF